jgi:pyrroloquinoline quinone (PQQ) biosynthesis protein C
MSQYESVVNATTDLYAEHLGGHKMMAHILNGDLSRGEYAAYLRETYHMVRHTSRMLALAAARCEDDRRGLRDWFITQTDEENNHDLFCIKDLRNMGHNPADVLAGQPHHGAWTLVCQNYFMATYGNPAGILGVASITEGLGASIAGNMADILVSNYGYRTETVTFMRSHSGFDAKHLEETEFAINELVKTPEDLEAVIQGRRMTIISYAQMFTDCMNHPYVPASGNDVDTDVEFAVAAE